MNTSQIAADTVPDPATTRQIHIAITPAERLPLFHTALDVGDVVNQRVSLCYHTVRCKGRGSVGILLAAVSFQA